MRGETERKKKTGCSVGEGILTKRFHISGKEETRCGGWSSIVKEVYTGRKGGGIAGKGEGNNERSGRTK